MRTRLAVVGILSGLILSMFTALAALEFFTML